MISDNADISTNHDKSTNNSQSMNAIKLRGDLFNFASLPGEPQGHTCSSLYLFYTILLIQLFKFFGFQIVSVSPQSAAPPHPPPHSSVPAVVVHYAAKGWSYFSGAVTTIPMKLAERHGWREVASGGIRKGRRH